MLEFERFIQATHRLYLGRELWCICVFIWWPSIIIAFVIASSWLCTNYRILILCKLLVVYVGSLHKQFAWLCRSFMGCWSIIYVMRCVSVNTSSSSLKKYQSLSREDANIKLLREHVVFMSHVPIVRTCRRYKSCHSFQEMGQRRR